MRKINHSVSNDHTQTMHLYLHYCRYSRLKPWTLYIVDVYASVKGNWVHLMNRDADALFIGISDSYFVTKTEEFCMPR